MDYIEHSSRLRCVLSEDYAECLAMAGQRGCPDGSTVMMSGDDVSETTAVLNKDDEDEFQAVGHRRNVCKAILAHLVSVLLLGVPYLVGYWKPGWWLRWTKSRYAKQKIDALLHLILMLDLIF